MNFEKWVKNHEKEKARFVFDSNATSLEEMQFILTRLENTVYCYRETLGILLWIIDEVEDRKEDLKSAEKNYMEILEFRNSEICKMIMDFCENNTQEKLKAIYDYIEKDNQFGIIINDHQEEIAAKATRELAYGFNIKNHFHVDKIYRYYNFDNCDVDNDLQLMEKDIEDQKSNYDKSEKTLKDYCEKYKIDEELLSYIKQNYDGKKYLYYEYDRDYDEHPYYQAEIDLYEYDEDEDEDEDF